MIDYGTQALETGEGINFARIRQDRFLRVLQVMERHGVDALLLSRANNAHYVTGALHLWTAGRKGFSPVVIVIRERREAYMTGWSADYGVPDSMPAGHIIPGRWDPSNFMSALKPVLSLFAKGTVGVDAMSEQWSAFLSGAFPQMALANGETLMREARWTKTPEEIACIKTAVGIAEGALAATLPLVKPGVREKELLGAFEHRAAELGAPLAVAQGGFCVQPRHRDGFFNTGAETPPLRQIASDLQLSGGDLVTLCGGVSYAGYEADIGRTWPCAYPSPLNAPQRDLSKRWLEAYQSMSEECRPGRTAADLRRAFERVAPLPHAPVAHGTGLGYEPPIVGSGTSRALEERWTLEPGMVLVLQPYVWKEGVGGFWAKETVCITTDGHRQLTSFLHPI